jgi:hypothetical protein
VLAGACSSAVDSGFISIGRDKAEPEESISGNGGISGSAGAPASSTMMGGTAGSVETGGTASSQGGTTGVNGGTSTGACSGETLPALGGSSVGGGAILDACESAGASQRICIGDDVWYCGQHVGGRIELCDPGTCATGCCHAAGDPCGLDVPPTGGEFGEMIDCAGDCYGGPGNCLHFGVPTVPLRLLENDLVIVRVGSGSAEVVCDDEDTSWFFDLELIGPAARLTVAPPWKLNATDGFASGACPQPSQTNCIVSEEGESRLVNVSTDVDDPPPRNVIIETSEIELSCP